MRKALQVLVGLAAGVVATTAHAAITVDGNHDSDYGLPKSTVLYDPNAPTSNFGNPGPTATTGYQIFLADQSGFVYGLIQATPGAGTPIMPIFANLYFGDAGTTGRGSVIGFEIANQDAFTPGVAGSVAAPITFARTASSIEFALPESYFTSPIGTLQSAGYNPGDTITLRLSQSLGYSVAGGQTAYGDARLGQVTLGGPRALGTPGPIAGAGLVPLLGLAGAYMFGRRKKVAV